MWTTRTECIKTQLNSGVDSFIPQQYSWSRLLISYEAICKLLKYLQVFPAFINILRAFGERAGHEDDSHSEILVQENERSSGKLILILIMLELSSHWRLWEMIETLYLIKHVERHEREEPKNPWSLRQMGVYHRTDNETGDTFVILNPSHPFRRLLKHVSKLSLVSNPWKIHMILLTSAMRNWRWCITYLEGDYENMVRPQSCCAKTVLKASRKPELI